MSIRQMTGRGGPRGTTALRLELRVDRSAFRVPPERLRWRCDPERFPFVCTDEIDPLGEFIGQDRALRALEFGLAVDRPGYNIFVTGMSGTGRASAIQTYLQRRIAERGDQRGRLRDWCYVHHFAEPDRPQLLSFPRGLGKTFQQRVERLLTDLRQSITRTLSGPEFDAQRKAVIEAAQAEAQALSSALERDVMAQGFLLRPTPVAIQLVPHVNGKPLSPQEYMALPEEVRRGFEAREQDLSARIQEVVEQTSQLQHRAAERVEALTRQAGEFATGRPFQDVAEDYSDYPQVVQFLQALRGYTLEHLDLFNDGDHPHNPGQPPAPQDAPGRQGLPRLFPEADPFLPFRVNVFVDNGGRTAPPVVIEPNPTYSNLFGKIERRAIMGAYMSDHTMLKPGALSLANGGYLILNAREALLNPGVWEGLKRALRSREVRMEDPMEQMMPGVSVPQGIRPEPMPLHIKVIMTGPVPIYQALSRADEEFWEVFKVKADFDSQIDVTDDHLEAYAKFICSCCSRNNLLPFHRTAVAEVVEHGARAVDDQGKLTSRFGQVEDLLIESDYWARRAGHDMVMDEDVRQALQEKVYRSSLIEERIRDLITEGTFLMDVDGTEAGQVNGLAVYDLGDVRFGRPSRVTARTFMGRSGVINIERESQLSGRTHDKGVLILSGYLGARYAQDKPLTLAASICFEQSYEGVDGDSASSTELYAVLSSLADAPIFQGIAVTGSVNQKGEVQPIGGVNEKIEGYFAVCKEKRLTGEQGVMIPVQNVRNLMLRQEVVEAVQQGMFHIYAVRTIDEGIGVLTGLPAGERDRTGAYPEGTINALVDRRLRELAQGILAFSGRDGVSIAAP